MQPTDLVFHASTVPCAPDAVAGLRQTLLADLAGSELPSELQLLADLTNATQMPAVRAALLAAQRTRTTGTTVQMVDRALREIRRHGWQDGPRTCECLRRVWSGFCDQLEDALGWSRTAADIWTCRDSDGRPLPDIHGGLAPIDIAARLGFSEGMHQWAASDYGHLSASLSVRVRVEHGLGRVHVNSTMPAHGPGRRAAPRGPHPTAFELRQLDDDRAHVLRSSQPSAPSDAGAQLEAMPDAVVRVAARWPWNAGRPSKFSVARELLACGFTSLDESAREFVLAAAPTWSLQVADLVAAAGDARSEMPPAATHLATTSATTSGRAHL